MSQVRRALVVLVSVIAVVVGLHACGIGASARSRPRRGTVRARSVHVAQAAARAVRATGWSATDGGIFSGGGAAFHGSTGAIALNQPDRRHGADPVAATATGWSRPTAASSPSATPRSTARPAPSRSTSPIVGMASTPTGNGYWLVASDGGIFSFGDAAFHGSTGAIPLNQPDRRHGRRRRPATATGWSPPTAASSPSATPRFHGSTGAITLNQPDRRHGVDARPATATGWSRPTAASSPSATPTFHGSTGAIALNQPDRRHGGHAARATATGSSAADGGVFSFGDAQFLGSSGSMRSQPGRRRHGRFDRRRFPASSRRHPATKLGVHHAARATSTGGVAFATQPVGDRARCSGATVTTDTSAVTLDDHDTRRRRVLTCDADTRSRRSPASRPSPAATSISAGTYTLHATDGTLDARHQRIGDHHRRHAAAKLGFTTQPSGATSCVVVRDAARTSRSKTSAATPSRPPTRAR